jgi:hypothetical protein
LTAALPSSHLAEIDIGVPALTTGMLKEALPSGPVTAS